MLYITVQYSYYTYRTYCKALCVLYRSRHAYSACALGNSLDERRGPIICRATVNLMQQKKLMNIGLCQ